MYITVDDFPPSTFADAARKNAGPPPGRRSLIERVLWGSAAESCDECGMEVPGSRAIRYPGGRVYCSLAHATEDLIS